MDRLHLAPVARPLPAMGRCRAVRAATPLALLTGLALALAACETVPPPPAPPPPVAVCASSESPAIVLPISASTTKPPIASPSATRGRMKGRGFGAGLEEDIESRLAMRRCVIGGLSRPLFTVPRGSVKKHAHEHRQRSVRSTPARVDCRTAYSLAPR